MNNLNARENRTTRRILPIACATALAVAFTVSLPQSAHADQVKPPPVPSNIQVPAGNKAFLESHGVGTQNYVCLPSGTGFKFTLFTPQATLFNEAPRMSYLDRRGDLHWEVRSDKEVTTHYFSPNPFEGGTIRATWQHSRDASTVWGQVLPGESSADPNFVAPGAIAWLLVTIVGAKDGSPEGDTLTATTFIQRLNTSGGVAPSTGCASSSDVGHQAFVPYTADYFFYKER